VLHSGKFSSYRRCEVNKTAAVLALKQVSHWHVKGFTPCHAIWRASEARTRDSVRDGDAGQVQCVLCRGKNSKLFNIIYFQDVTTCHD